MRKCALLLLSVVMIFVFSAISFGGVNDGLVAYWPFDENTLDSIGNHHGTVHGDAFIGEGKIGNACHFDGAGDYIQIAPNLYDELSNSPFSWAMWIKAKALPNFPPARNTPVITNDVHCMPTRFTFSNAKLFSFGVYSGCNQGNSVSANINLNEWYHIAAAIDDGQLKLYVNGQLTDSFPVSYHNIATLNGSFKIGGNNRIGRYFTGIIDDVRIYDRALSEAEIQQLYSGGGNPGPPAAPHLTVATNGTFVTLSWTPVPGATGYYLYADPSQPGAAFDGSFDFDWDLGNNTSIDATLSEGSCFYVAVKAYNNAGSGDYSNNEQVTVTANIPQLQAEDFVTITNTASCGTIGYARLDFAMPSNQIGIFDYLRVTISGPNNTKMILTAVPTLYGDIWELVQNETLSLIVDDVAEQVPVVGWFKKAYDIGKDILEIYEDHTDQSITGFALEAEGIPAMYTNQSYIVQFISDYPLNNWAINIDVEYHYQDVQTTITTHQLLHGTVSLCD